MPVQFAPGIMAEHLHARSAAGLFDVSHMGQIILRPCSGNTADAALALERLVPVDVLGLGEGRQRYAFFTNEKGGILDDLMIANRGDPLTRKSVVSGKSGSLRVDLVGRRINKKKK